jgi:UDP-glucose 4,6-dehydratase
VKACLDCWFQKVPFGIYNVTNPGYVSTAEVLEMIKEILKPEREFEFWENDAEFYTTGAVAPRSNCIMECQKLQQAGIIIPPVRTALLGALDSWRSL